MTTDFDLGGRTIVRHDRLTVVLWPDVADSVARFASDDKVAVELVASVRAAGSARAQLGAIEGELARMRELQPVSGEELADAERTAAAAAAAEEEAVAALTSLDSAPSPSQPRLELEARRAQLHDLLSGAAADTAPVQAALNSLRSALVGRAPDPAGAELLETLQIARGARARAFAAVTSWPDERKLAKAKARRDETVKELNEAHEKSFRKEQRVGAAEREVEAAEDEVARLSLPAKKDERDALVRADSALAEARTAAGAFLGRDPGDNLDHARANAIEPPSAEVEALAAALTSARVPELIPKQLTTAELAAVGRWCADQSVALRARADLDGELRTVEAKLEAVTADETSDAATIDELRLMAEQALADLRRSKAHADLRLADVRARAGSRTARVDEDERAKLELSWVPIAASLRRHEKSILTLAARRRSELVERLSVPTPGPVVVVEPGLGLDVEAADQVRAFLEARADAGPIVVVTSDTPTVAWGRAMPAVRGMLV